MMYRKMLLVSTLLAGTALPAMAQSIGGSTSQDITGDLNASLNGRLDQNAAYGGQDGNHLSNGNNVMQGGSISGGNTSSTGNSTNIGATSNNSAGGSVDFHNNDLGSSSSASGGAGGNATGGKSDSTSKSGSYSGGSVSTSGSSSSQSSGGESSSRSRGGAASATGGSTGAVTNDNRSNSRNKSNTAPLTALSLAVPGPRTTAGTQFIAPNGTAPIEAHDVQFGWGLFQNSYEGPTDAGTIGTRVSLIGQACAIPADQGRSAAVQLLAALDSEAGKALAHNGCR